MRRTVSLPARSAHTRSPRRRWRAARPVPPASARRGTSAPSWCALRAPASSIDSTRANDQTCAPMPAVMVTRPTSSTASQSPGYPAQRVRNDSENPSTTLIPVTVPLRKLASTVCVAAGSGCCDAFVTSSMVVRAGPLWCGQLTTDRPAKPRRLVAIVGLTRNERRGRSELCRRNVLRLSACRVTGARLPPMASNEIVNCLSGVRSATAGMKRFSGSGELAELGRHGATCIVSNQRRRPSPSGRRASKPDQTTSTPIMACR